MGKKFKQLLTMSLAMMMAAMLCLMAIPSYQVRAATKSVTVKITDDGGEADVSLYKGQTAQIKVKKKGKSYSKVTYKVTSGKSVVSVSSKGLITAKKNGDAEITIKDKKSGYSAVVTVDVKKSKVNKVYKIWLSKPSITLDLGQGYHCDVFTNEVGSNGSVHWQSEDSGIATVDDNGNIRATGHGSTRVYAYKGGRNAAIMVYVN